MDETFDLSSTMLPKVTKQKKNETKKYVALATKKYFRRSSIVLNENRGITDNSCINITSSSSSASSQPSEKNTPIDKEEDSKKLEKNYSDNYLTKNKFTAIKQWVEEVNYKNTSVYSELSTIDGSICLADKTSKKSFNSTFAKHKFERIDQLIQRHSNKIDTQFRPGTSDENCDKTNKLDAIDAKSKQLDYLEKYDCSDDSFTIKDRRKNEEDLLIDDSFDLEINTSLTTRILQKTKNLTIDLSGKCSKKSEDFDLKKSQISSRKDEDSYDETPKFAADDVCIEDSFEADLDKSLLSRITSKRNDTNSDNQGKNEDEEIGEYELLLDDIYGDGWREKKDLIFSEPRKNVGKTYKIKSSKPQTELKTKMWRDRLKHLYDSESESDKEIENCTPKKLVFDEDSDSDRQRSAKKIQVFKTPRKITGKSADEPLSFLASLASDVPILKCDFSARIYRNNFQQYKDELTKKLFDDFNEKVFDNVIPKDMEIQWNTRLLKTAGRCYCKKITRKSGKVERLARLELSTKVVDSADRLRNTLIHEMCHAATWLVNEIHNGHGPFWQAWAQKAMKTFPELPPIKRCHDYEINTKYTYKCIGCGYCVGRHTKSLDIERKRCGYCYGKFEVLVNRKLKNGEVKAGYTTPKKPANAFALFVKENYANYKTPELKHGDVMKILGQKFGDLKVGKSNIPT